VADNRAGSGGVYNRWGENLIKNRKSGLSMRPVTGSTFAMGSPSTERGRDDDECLQQVTVKSFKIGYYEVTQADWVAVMGTNPSYFKNCPVETVSWDDIQDFLIKLETQTGQKFRLPTEAEWEFAARGGNESKKYLYAGGNILDDVAWNGNNSDSKTHAVGTKMANELGLFDMSGNVYEWCQDVYKAYPCDNKNRGSSSSRCLRGGGWIRIDLHRSAERLSNAPSLRIGDYGFRLAQD
jgi:formylglycine-generating enzyme required for sulfatase activity